MKEFELKYGCNPNQKPARVFMKEGELPLEILNGRPGYINFLDALNSWQLVKELDEATGLASAASFKHVSPAGAALGYALNETEKRMYFAKSGEFSDIAAAYIRARGSDRLSSFGDWAALSRTCDETAALYLKHEVSDGIIAPAYTKKALEILKTKKKGAYAILKIDPSYEPPEKEQREVFGICFEQARNNLRVGPELFKNIVTQNKDIPDGAVKDLILSMITLKYTQSNSVCFVKGGQAVGIGAGQQSRIHCTRLAGGKADRLFLRSHPKVLELPFKEGLPKSAMDNAVDIYISDDSSEILSDGEWQKLFKVRPGAFTTEEKALYISKESGLSLGSDAFFPFEDNIKRAFKSGVKYVAEPGGSLRDKDVIGAADAFGMVMAFTGARLFHH